MPASPDTLLRLVRRMPLPPAPPPRAIGIDDWALRKGQSYGTILVDLVRRRPLDLLPGRTAAALAEWLRRHPSIRIVTRDRSTEYARGVLEGAPQARQVADRWHLLQNVRQVAERWLAGTHARLRRLPPLTGTATSGSQRAGAFPRSRGDAAVGAESRVRRLALYEEIRRRHATGEPLLTISRRMGLARGTVRYYALAESFPERALPRPRPSIIDPHLAYLNQRRSQGFENALALWRELRARGFPGTRRQVARWLQPRRRVPSPFGPRPACSPVRPINVPPAHLQVTALPSARSLAWMMANDPAVLSSDEAGAIERIAQDKEAATMIALVQRFAGLIRASSIAAASPHRAPLRAFRRWTRDATASGLRAMMTFAAALQNDTAVQAALCTPWSNAQCEGHITRLKLLKRQMYGRASLDLLHRRMLLAT
jgi:transposase